MKRLIALLLAIALCLCLAACGGGDKSSATGDKPSANGDKPGQTQGNDPAAGIKEDLLGRWLPHGYTRGENSDKLADFREDGTVVIGEKTLTWEIVEDSVIYINDGEDRLYLAEFTAAEDGQPSFLRLYRYKTATTTSVWCEYYKESDYTKLEITAENWQDYFEVQEFSTLVKDAFGEITKIEVYRAFALKDSYGVVCAQISNMTVEYSTKRIGYYVTADKTTGEYTIGEIADPHDNWPANTETMVATKLNAEGNRFGIRIGADFIDKFPEDTVDIRSEFTVLRIAGTLYTYPAPQQ